MTDDSDLSIAQPEDFFHHRNEDDELQPVTQPLPGVEEHIRVVPLTMGDINEYGDGEALNPADLSFEEVAQILNEHWYDVRVNDDFEVTAEMVEEDMIGFGRDALLQAVLRASGYNMTQALNMENLEMLQEVDEGNLETLINLAEKRSN